jgi:membrane protein DedA with SNARE-associated domain
MKKYLKLVFVSFLLWCVGFLPLAYGQVQPKPEMADMMRSDGKIYVVVATLCIILAGVLGYLIWIDRKISKIE